MLSLFSYNILRGKKLDQIIDWFKINKIYYDIICFQEFPETNINDFLELLPQDSFTYQFSPGFKFSLLRKKNDVYGQLTIFNKQKLRLISSRIVNLGTSQIEKRLFRNDIERTALLTKFSYKDSPFLLVNCHLTPLTLNSRRINQLELILAQIRDNDKALIVGDYNYPIRRKGLISFMKENDFENGTLNLKTHKLLFIRQQLDYIFSKGCGIEHIAMHTIKFSDHYPLIAQFSPDTEVLSTE